jgi:hypothetical protein
VASDGRVQAVGERGDPLGERRAARAELRELERCAVQQTMESIDAVGEVVGDLGRAVCHGGHRVAHPGHLERRGHRRPGPVAVGSGRADLLRDGTERCCGRDD